MKNEPDVINTIFCASSVLMPQLPDESVQLVVTSPPYNVGIDSSDALLPEAYVGMLARVFHECYRVLVVGGRLVVVVANVGRRPYVRLTDTMCGLADEAGFLLRGEIIWRKGAGRNTSCAWGSFRSAANPVLRDIHEYVMVFSKEHYGRNDKSGFTMCSMEFMTATLSVWDVRPETQRLGHPSPFPVALAEKIIRLYSFEGDTVLDPFMGSGTTAIAAIRNDRQFVGYEINPFYAAIAQKRIAEG